MKLWNWYKSRSLWVRILLPLLLVMVCAAIPFGVKAVRVVVRTRQMISRMQETGDIGQIHSESASQSESEQEKDPLADIINTPPELQGDYLNLLIVGIDYDEGDEQRDYGSAEDANTDVILYMHYDIKNKKISLLQIPRDCYVGEITDNLRINSIFAQGENQTNHIANLAGYISKAFGLPIDNFVSLDMAAFKEIIDVFGGLDVYLPCDIYIYDADGNPVLMAPEGPTRLNGTDAEIVVRARKQFAQADLQRLVLQRYIYAGMYRLIRSATVKDLYTYVLPVVSYRIKTDLDANTMFGLLVDFLEISGENIYFVRVPGGSIHTDGQSVYGVDSVALAEILNAHFSMEGQEPYDAANMIIPSGWDYPQGEIIDEGGYLSEQLESYENAG